MDSYTTKPGSVRTRNGTLVKGTLVLRGDECIGAFVEDADGEAALCLEALNGSLDVRYAPTLDPDPCDECGQVGTHANWCEDAIDTVLVEEVQP